MFDLKNQVAVVTGASSGLGVIFAKALAGQGREEELMSTVVYLAAPETSYTTGVTIPVDGGWTAV